MKDAAVVPRCTFEHLRLHARRCDVSMAMHSIATTQHSQDTVAGHHWLRAHGRKHGWRGWALLIVLGDGCLFNEVPLYF